MITHWTRRFDLGPLNELQRLQRQMNRLFQNFGGQEEAYPSVNLWSDAEKAVVTSEIPGIEIKDLNITVKGTQLIIEGEKKPTLSKDIIYHRNERGYGKFVKTVPLPFEVQEDKITAKYKNGVLNITLPRAEATKPRKIEISKE